MRYINSLPLPLLLLLRIRSAQLELLGFPISGANQYKDIFVRLKTMRRNQNFAIALGFQMKIGANHAFFRDK